MSRRTKTATRAPPGASDTIDEESFTYLVLALPLLFVWFAWVAFRTIARRPMESVPVFWFMVAFTQVAPGLVVFNGRGTTAFVRAASLAEMVAVAVTTIWLWRRRAPTSDGDGR